jgi:hypothetical protein
LSTPSALAVNGGLMARVAETACGDELPAAETGVLRGGPDGEQIVVTCTEALAISQEKAKMPATVMNRG